MFLLFGLPHGFPQRALLPPDLLHGGSHLTVMHTTQAESLIGVKELGGECAERLFAGEHFGHRLKIVGFMPLGTAVCQGLCLGLDM